MKNLFFLLLIIGFSIFATEVEPLKVVQISGGCCHDYPNQQNINKDGLEKRINCTVENFTEGTKRDHRHSLFDKKDWSKVYDVILYNIRCGGITDESVHL